MRKTQFAVGEYYHIYNRGVDKRNVFVEDSDYDRLLKSIKEFNTTKSVGSLKDLQALRARKGRKSNGLLEPGGERLVDILCYCLNPNHYHFILRQSSERGIERFMHKIGMGYTNYFNKKYDRTGSLFQGPFKSVHISTNEHLLYLSAYVNANHGIHGLSGNDWKYSSLLDYLGRRRNDLCEKDPILKQFRNNYSEYEEYLRTNAESFKKKKEGEEYWLE